MKKKYFDIDENDIVKKDTKLPKGLSEDERNVEKQEEFEHKFNFRYKFFIFIIFIFLITS